MSKIKLLMIDDDEIFLNNYRLLLKDEFELETASNLTQGWKLLSEYNPQILLLDIRLKTEKEGLEILPEIKKQFPHIFIIMVTNWDSHSIFKQALQLGADDFFIKSEDLEILKMSIYNLIHNNFEESQDEMDNFPIAVDPVSKGLLRQARKIARANCAVIITGESGVGKEEIARYIHRNSKRKEKPFVAINCAAIPDTLMESEFFGHEAGAFTNALKRRIGKFELANGGTLFLDEIEELSLSGQTKLLRVTQDFVLERLGSNESIAVDVRLISATRNNLKQLVSERKFREDLFYRLAVFPLHIPPLRERREDIVPLSQFYLKQSCEKNGFKNKQFTNEALLILKNYDWPGNVRELKNVVEKAVILSHGRYIKPSDLQLYSPENQELLPYELAKKKVVDEFTMEYIRQALLKNDGNITRTAQNIGLSRQMLQRLIKEYKIN